MSFESLELDQHLLNAVAKMGHTRPTSIQKMVIPPAMDERDIMASAPTGTGKTLAFLLPAVQRLIDYPRRKGGSARILLRCIAVWPLSPRSECQELTKLKSRIPLKTFQRASHSSRHAKLHYFTLLPPTNSMHPLAFSNQQTWAAMEKASM